MRLLEFVVGLAITVLGGLMMWSAMKSPNFTYGQMLVVLVCGLVIACLGVKLGSGHA